MKFLFGQESFIPWFCRNYPLFQESILSLENDVQRTWSFTEDKTGSSLERWMAVMAPTLPPESMLIANTFSDNLHQVLPVISGFGLLGSLSFQTGNPVKSEQSFSSLHDSLPVWGPSVPPLFPDMRVGGKLDWETHGVPPVHQRFLQCWMHTVTLDLQNSLGSRNCSYFSDREIEAQRGKRPI